MQNKKRKPAPEALKSLRENIEKKKKLSQEILQQYKQSYKNILWIDDIDNKQASGYLSEEEARLNWMKNWLMKEDMCMQIEQVSLFREAVDRITTRSAQYDLVIFDINLKEGFDDIVAEDKKALEETFKNYHIPFKYEEVDKKFAGYLLYRLLLAVGYPLKRMLIFSANVNEKTAKGRPDGIIFNNDNFVSKESVKLDIEKKFFEPNTQGYYLIRRLVCQACSYWTDKLKEELNDNESIPFNKLYYFNGNNHTQKAVTARSFIEMLEHIQMLFHVAMPYAPDKLYYKAMQTVAAFHEESAKIQTINSHPNLKRYHSCVRNFRNWSSHNLMETKLSAQQFALLFCITLRTYFSWNSDFDLNNALFDYEKIYGFNEIKDINDINVEKLGDNLLEIWEKVHKKLKNKYFSDLEEAIRELGKTVGCGDMSDYLFIPIWCPTDFLLPAKKQPGGFKKSGCVLIEVNQKSISGLCDKVTSTNDNSADISFKRNSFQWVVMG